MCARSKPSVLEEKSPQSSASPKARNGVLECQLHKLVEGSSHLQVHARASLKFLLRKKHRQLRGDADVPATPTPLPLPKALQDPEAELEGPAFNRQISAPAAVQLTVEEAFKQADEKKVQEKDAVRPEAPLQDPPKMRREAKSSALFPHASTYPGWGRQLPTFWPEYVLDLFKNVRREQMPPVSPAECGFRLLCGSHQLPHPQKASTGGEDSFFLCANGSAAGVADGVGEWQWRFGLDPRAFADEMMQGARITGEQTQFQAGLPAEARAKLMLSEGYKTTHSFGSATALVAALDPNGEPKLGVANLGDSGLRVLRWRCPGECPESSPGVYVVHRTCEQQHAFNCPYQLARLPEPKDYAALQAQGLGSLVKAVEKSGSSKQDTPCDADIYTFEVQEGDVVLMGTDGVFDNIHDHEVCELAQGPLEAAFRNREKATAWQIDPSRLANAFAEAARARSQDRSAKTPFGNCARSAGLQHMGGKMDDVTVVVGMVVKI
mmetsp:Transcript_4369/g.10120  ORF Transcript_4369/g.10120 Transcript_4369/m.10120 type:complete len:493 (+) Transcript_4369:98-1576(+)